MTLQEKEFKEWQAGVFNSHAMYVEDYFAKFAYIFEVDPEKFLIWHIHCGPVCPEFFYPAVSRELAAWWVFVRGDTDYTHKFLLNGVSGRDAVFVATNDPLVATQLILKYS